MYKYFLDIELNYRIIFWVAGYLGKSHPSSWVPKFMVPWRILSNQLPWLKVQTSKPALWPYPPGIEFQVPGCTWNSRVTRSHHWMDQIHKENDTKLTNEDGFFSTSSCMNFDKIIFIICIYTRMYIYILSCTAKSKKTVIRSSGLF